jgi:hypothetical protein
MKNSSHLISGRRIIALMVWQFMQQLPCDVINSRITHDDVVSFVCVEVYCCCCNGCGCTRMYSSRRGVIDACHCRRRLLAS